MQPRQFLTALFALILGGCTPPSNLAEVTGTVTYKGQPLPDAVVLFVPNAGPAAAGATLENGTYRLTSRRPGDGVVSGRCKVAITAADPERKPLAIPGKYLDAETSGLLVEVKKEGKNVIDFAISDE